MNLVSLFMSIMSNRSDVKPGKQNIAAIESLFSKSSVAEHSSAANLFTDLLRFGLEVPVI